jgi:hypothetical protein
MFDGSARESPVTETGAPGSKPIVPGYGLAVAAKVAQNFLMEPGVKRSVIVEVLNGQAHDGNSAALPLQIAITVVDVAPRAAMVGPSVSTIKTRPRPVTKTSGLHVLPERKRTPGRGTTAIVSSAGKRACKCLSAR